MAEESDVRADKASCAPQSQQDHPLFRTVQQAERAALPTAPSDQRRTAFPPGQKLLTKMNE